MDIEQARHEIELPQRFGFSIRVGGRIALWEGLLAAWVVRMRRSAPDVSIRSEIGFEQDLMRRLIEGTLDVGLMHTPSHAPGLVVEHLFDETLVLVSSNPKTRWADDEYIDVDWGPGFYAKHRESDPDLQHAPQVVNVGWLAIQIILAGGGSCFLPIRMAQPLIAAGRLSQCAAAPELTHPACMVFPREIEDENLRDALHTLRMLSREASTG